MQKMLITNYITFILALAFIMMLFFLKGQIFKVTRCKENLPYS